MKSMHNKLIVSGMSFPKKISTLLRKKIMAVRLPILEKIDYELKSNAFFEHKQFLWLNIIEQYGDFDNREIIIRGIDKNYGDLDVSITIPMKEIGSLDERQLEVYYEAAFHEIIAAAYNEQITNYTFKAVPAYLKGEKAFFESIFSSAREQVSQKIKKSLEQSTSFGLKKYKNIKILEHFGNYQSLDIDIEKIDTVSQSVCVEIAIPSSLFSDEDILANPILFFEEIYSLVLKKLKIKL